MSETMTGLEFKINEVAARIKEMRQIEGISADTMARLTGVSREEYVACEEGKHDLSFAFIYRCALAFKVGVTDIIEGESATLKSFTVTRRGEGQKIDQAHGMVYHSLASNFKNRVSEPLFVNCIYDESAERRDIDLTTHAGQELDIVLTGSLKVQIGSHSVVLNAGDSVYFDSSTPHGMIAVGGTDCEFYAIVLHGEEKIVHTEEKDIMKNPNFKPHQSYKRVYHDFIDTVEDENGSLESISFKNEDKFNFAYDVVDKIAERKPEKLAMVHLDKYKNETRFTFLDFKKESARCANYFESIGIKRGSKVMLVLKRHYQFWIAILALHKIGAVAIPASNLLQEHDYEYRYEAAEVDAILCSADGDIANQAELGSKKAPCLKEKIIVGGKKDGWRDFDEEYKAFPDEYERKEDSPCGEDDMLMYFTSGTTGNPKMALHSYKYPLGHFHTANYWHCVNPEGLHLTISDTGWAKAAWGKIYGQWLCEAPLFV